MNDTCCSTPSVLRDNDCYEPFLASIREHFDACQSKSPHLFTTDAKDRGLFSTFLGALPTEERQAHNCNACRHFVERYGHLVSISDDGTTEPVMWGPAPGIYAEAFEGVRRIVSRARVTGVFVSYDPVLGQPVTPSVKSPNQEFHHMAVKLPTGVRRHTLLTAGQRMAELREEHAMLCRGLAEFSAETVAAAERVLRADALYRSEKVLGVAEWLRELHAKRAATEHRERRDNVTWLAVAGAPPGFCHVKSTMIGTLLEDLASGLPFEAVQARFKEKMHPLQYQRPQAAPSDAQLEAAERVVAQLASAGSLERRFARMEDVQVRLWEPPVQIPTNVPVEGVFGHLKQKKAPPQITLPEVKMTWRKFAAEVLPTAVKLEYHVRSGQLPLIGLVTAVHADAPPILQWDSLEQRNPVSWFVFHHGSVAEAWNLTRGVWVPVTAVTPLPMLWHRPEAFRHQGEGVVFLLEGCRCLINRSLVLFPEHLRSEYHAIRRTIEAYSERGQLAGSDEATACGIDFRKGREGTLQLPLRVTTQEGQALYLLDRWD